MQFEKEKMAASLLALKRHESSVQYMTLLQSNPLMQQRTDFHVMVDREGLFQEDDRSACAEKFLSLSMYSTSLKPLARQSGQS